MSSLGTDIFSMYFWICSAATRTLACAFVSRMISAAGCPSLTIWAAKAPPAQRTRTTAANGPFTVRVSRNSIRVFTMAVLPPGD